MFSLIYFDKFYEKIIKKLLSFLDIEKNEDVLFSIIFIFGEIGFDNKEIGEKLLEDSFLLNENLKTIITFTLGLINYNPAYLVIKEIYEKENNQKDRFLYMMALALYEGIYSKYITEITEFQMDDEFFGELEGIDDYFYFKLVKNERLKKNKLDISKSIDIEFDYKEIYTYNEVLSIIEMYKDEISKLDQGLLSVISKLPIEEKTTKDYSIRSKKLFLSFVLK